MAHVLHIHCLAGGWSSIELCGKPQAMEGMAMFHRKVAICVAGLVLSGTSVQAASIPAYVTSWGGQGSATGQFYQPEDVALGPVGDVYVADRGNNRIQVFTPGGTFLRELGVGILAYPRGVAVSSSGDVYVADTNNNRIVVLDHLGAVMRMWGSLGSGPGQMSGPARISLAQGGLVYVTDQLNDRIEVFAEDGTFVREFGNPLTLGAPLGTDVDPSGQVLVAAGARMVAEFDATGSFVRFVGEGAGMDLAWGVRRVPDGSVYVSDPRHGRIVILDSAGSIVGDFGDTDHDSSAFCHGAADDLCYPMGMAVTSSGRLYAASMDSHRVSVYEVQPTPVERHSWGSLKLIYRK